ncbi:hypothetical protein [Emcibacter nanhaiensis]|uniref:Motility protein B-like N-terminal domain-containing protein n=1 Tax=Emcibacter nanhaiensis TaxID=1505037 RepID=A0A501PSU9_9PROT|nr:hypothetical protein [Emcibacter nanhaiensis]TPD62846.1 hypothetical protein FIV46_01835 [Emcibacter nanhaiensis]
MLEPDSAGDTEENKSAGDQTTGIFVSLYLIVLAFFMVMNSISNQEQNKVSAVTESVTRAFRNPFEPDADFIDVTSSEDSVTPNDEFYDQIQGVFASLVGFDGKFPSKGGHIISVNFSVNDLFERGTAQFRIDQQEFLNQLTSFLRGGRASEKREIEFLVSTGDSLPAGPQYWKDLNILRAGAIVTKLEDMGVAPDQISIGVAGEGKNRIRVTFFNRERISARQTLSGFEGMPRGDSEAAKGNAQ